MDGIAVDRVDVAFLVVIEDAVADERSGADNMPVGEDVALLSIHDKASRL